MLTLKTSCLISFFLVSVAGAYAVVTAYVEPSEQKAYARILDARAARASAADGRIIEANAY